MIPSFNQIIKSIEQLPAAEQEGIRRWLKDKGTTNGEGHGSKTQTAKEAYSKSEG
jgi:hypothetical protein